MAILGLNVPTEIRWERLCVTRDMVDRSACDEHSVPKWQSSIAIFKFVPEEEYQVYPGRKLTYIKVSCSLSGYQPRGSEIEGRIDWRGLDVSTVGRLEELLATYLPCNEALLQITVTPRETAVPLDEYPYIMDFQPKKRELFEMVTETNERMSRSLESLSVRKAAGTTEGQEVLDIDQGVSFGAQASYMGTGGGFNYARQGQWGTKRLGGVESSVTSTTDESRERREGLSHTTQLTQMYHLLDSYHVGTNRVLFFIQPRPHILQEPSGFVRGPRPIDGIQEFFLVVSQPREQADFCVAARLDTGHLATTSLADYDRGRNAQVSCQASAQPPERQNPTLTGEPAPERRLPITLFGARVGDAVYRCYVRREMRTETFRPPEGFMIDVARGGGYSDIDRTERGGTSTVSVSPESLTIRCEAVAHACYHDHNTVILAFGTPEEIEKRPAFVNREVLVHLISRERTIPQGTRKVMVVTTRGLCCCPRAESSLGEISGRLIGVINLSERVGQMQAVSPRAPAAAASEAVAAGAGPAHTGMMSAREANALTEVMRDEMLKAVALSDRETPDSQLTLQSKFLIEGLWGQKEQSEQERELLQRPVEGLVPDEAAEVAAKLVGKSVSEMTRDDFLKLPARALAAASPLSRLEVNHLKLALLGVPIIGGQGDSQEGGGAKKPG